MRRWGLRRSGDPVRAYQARRATPHRESVCNAPLTNLYLQADGRAAPCWKYYPRRPPYWSPETSLADIWDGPVLATVRAAHREGRFIGPCDGCEHDIRHGVTPLAAAYDNDRPIGRWPTMLELELSNLCNLACTMCNGLLSSRIRREREDLPPLDVPYDETFVDQVAELLPHLHELRLNGGEPLLQPLVHLLGARVAELRPDLRVTIATNGTVWNSKVERLLATCTVHLNISIDSLVPERYEAIRVHGDLAKLMENVERFHAYCRDNDRDLCIMVNPMRENWEEMPDFLWWCAERELPIWFNTIREPKHLALHTLPRGELEHVAATLRAAPLPPVGADVVRRNANVYAGLLTQVEVWAEEADQRDRGGTPVALRRR